MDTKYYDGTYAYRFLNAADDRWHTTWFNVDCGLIVESLNLRRTPVGPFIGRSLPEFVVARLSHDWPHKDDRCLQWS